MNLVDIKTITYPMSPAGVKSDALSCFKMYLPKTEINYSTVYM